MAKLVQDHTQRKGDSGVVGMEVESGTVHLTSVNGNNQRKISLACTQRALKARSWHTL
jgi:hypothetical protein